MNLDGADIVALAEAGLLIVGLFGLLICWYIKDEERRH